MIHKSEYMGSTLPPNHDCGNECSRLYAIPSLPPDPNGPNAYSYGGVPPGTSEYTSHTLPSGRLSVCWNAVAVEE